MYCLSNMCYVCLKHKDSLLTNLNSSLSANSDVLHIIGELPFNLAWLTTMQTILVCEECCSRLRETYRLQAMCLKNSALLRDYVHSLNTGTETEAQLTVSMDTKEAQSTSNTGHIAEDQVHSEEEDITTLRWRPNLAELDKEFVDFEDALLEAGIICKNHVDDKQDHLSRGTIEESGDVFANVQDYFVKEEDSWKQEPADDTEEWPVDNSSVGIAAEAEDVTVNLQDYFVKEEDCWKREPADDAEECPVDNSSVEIAAETEDVTVNLEDNRDTNEVQSLSNTGHTAELHVPSEEVEINTLQWRPNFAEIDKVFVDFEDALIKAGIISKTHVDDKQVDSGKREEIADTKECPMDNSSTDKLDNESDPEISVNSDGPASHTDSDSSEGILRRIHSGEKPYKCSVCDKCFGQCSTLRRHMRIHTGEMPYKCSVCAKCFGQCSDLRRHMRIHTGEKLHKCSECDKCFSERSYLVAHTRIHTGEKPYKCSVCDKCFNQRPHLELHMRIHTGEKSYKCSECDKCFSYRSTLRRHMRIHSGEKSYKCSECDKCFSRRPFLVAHMRIHTGEKPYKCSECDKCFSQRPNLAAHMRTHTGEKPYACSRCDKCFRQRQSLVSHMRVHTRE